MPADTTVRKKRVSATDPTPAPDGDHRKRRRNRTTQSCLNCHASKRMCDRKRPACQRCTTLGLTGLCVYEVDDPSQRGTHQDEKSVLRSRVAELEGVIREMKNKPHPRWVQKAIVEDNVNKWHRDRGDSFSSQTSDMPSSSSSSSASSRSDSDTLPTPVSERDADPAARASQSPPRIQLSIVSPTPVSSPPPDGSSRFLRPPPLHLHHGFSPDSSPSPNLHSPISDVSPMFSIPGTPLGGSSPCLDVASLFGSTTLEPSGFEEGLYGHILDQIMRADDAKSNQYDRSFDSHHSHDSAGRPCECLENPVAYNTILELSVRLRKAAETLGRLAEHSNSSDCSLYSKVAELDALTSTTIGNATAPYDRPTAPTIMGYDHFPMAPTHVYRAPPSHNLFPSTISPQSLHTPHQWATHTSHAHHNSADEDSLMSWNMTRASDWPTTTVL